MVSIVGGEGETVAKSSLSFHRIIELFGNSFIRLRGGRAEAGPLLALGAVSKSQGSSRSWSPMVIAPQNLSAQNARLCVISEGHGRSPSSSGGLVESDWWEGTVCTPSTYGRSL